MQELGLEPKGPRQDVAELAGVVDKSMGESECADSLELRFKVCGTHTINHEIAWKFLLIFGVRHE